MLERPHRQFSEALEAFERDTTSERVADAATLGGLAAHYDDAADWFESTKTAMPRQDHSDEFLFIEVFDRQVDDLRATASAIRDAMLDPEVRISRRRVHQLYVLLERIFSAELGSFERKQFASLSLEPNKAMNLNSYLSLMGHSFGIIPSPRGPLLVPSGARAPDLSVPGSDYVLTLDADSILLPEYCLRLVYLMEQPENSDIAVAQTPYSAFRGTSSLIERIAGATTDLQYIARQGLTQFNATSWVGANAVIRKTALDELTEVEDNNGFPIKRYVRDRTVIEDTDSSIDLRSRGWRLYNYPERLSYSATPSDFGSLVIQRRRWSNGGLIILPRLIKQLWSRHPGVPRPSFSEVFLRLNYLASVSWAAFSLALMLFYPFDDQLLSRFAIVTALPYFWAMATDLSRTGYKFWDVFALYGFNLLLLPVNFVGTIESLIQGIGGHKLPFARTPKILNHTVAPLLFILTPIVIIVWSVVALGNDLEQKAYFHGFFAATNALALVFACLFLIGLRTMVVDVLVNLRDFVYRPVARKEERAEIPHWASVLYVGSSVQEEAAYAPSLALTLAAHDSYATEPEYLGQDAVPAMYTRVAETNDAR